MTFADADSGKLASTVGAILHFFLVAVPQDVYRWLTLRRKDVTGQVIVVTGGASGIGQRMAEIFSLELGANVVVLDVDADRAERVAAGIREQGGVASAWRCDVTRVEQVQSCADEIKKLYGKVDIIIANAAILHFAHFLQLTTEQIKSSLDVNIMGTLNTIRVFLADMEKSDSGHIVAMCSIAGFCGETYGMAYCPTKFAVRGAMECLRMELRDRELDGIACTTLCPYFVRTPMVLDKGIRPTSRFISFMSVEKCARRAVDAILKEKVLAFIPSWICMIPMFNALFSLKMQKTGRDYLNCRYDPGSHYEPAPSQPLQSTTVVSSEEHPVAADKHHSNGTANGQPPSAAVDSLPPMANGKMKGKNATGRGGIRLAVHYFESVHPLWMVVIPTALALTFLMWYSPASVNVWWLGPLGQFAHRLGTRYNGGMMVLNAVAWSLHLGEAVYSLYLADELKFTHACGLKWFAQTLLYGVFSLRILLRYRAKQRGKGKMVQ